MAGLNNPEPLAKVGVHTPLACGVPPKEPNKFCDGALEHRLTVPLVPAFGNGIIFIVTVEVDCGQIEVETVYVKTYGLPASVKVETSTVP